MMRLAALSDSLDCIAIMNQAIALRTNAFLKPFTTEAGAEWFHLLFSNTERLFVFETDSKVVAWGSLSAYRKGRGALSSVSEITFYVHKEHWRKGVASALIQGLEKESSAMKKKHLIAILLDDNASSFSLLRKHGYALWGQLPQIADFGDQVKGQLYMGKKV